MTISITAADVATLAAGGTVSLVGPAPVVVVTPPPPPPPTYTGPNPITAISIAGGKFVDQNGKPVQMRGVNCSALEFVAIQGWDGADPWGGQHPTLSQIRAWGVNTIRLPLNEASWLGQTTYDGNGKARNPDPGANYQATVKKFVDDCTALGMVVIIDNHWCAGNFMLPGQAAKVPLSPMLQTQFMDADHSLAFWTSVAAMFKGYKNVILELFNEPFLDSWGPTTPADIGVVQRDGGTCTRVPNGSEGGGDFTISQVWSVLGFQQALNAVRAAGFNGIVAVSDRQYAEDLSQWIKYKPTDPLNQLTAVWHAYPQYGATFGTPAYALPNLGQAAYANALSIITAGIPVMVTEFGGKDSPGTKPDPFTTAFLAWFMAQTVGTVAACAWCWDTYGNSDNVLIKSDDTPTDGFGIVVFNTWKGLA